MISMLCTFVDRFKKGTVNDTGLAGVSLQRDISKQGKRASRTRLPFFFSLDISPLGMVLKADLFGQLLQPLSTWEGDLIGRTEVNHGEEETIGTLVRETRVNTHS